MAEHSFQVLMPNSPLLLKYSCFGASFLYKNIYSRILARVRVVAMATEFVKNKAYKQAFAYLKNIQSLGCFHRLPTMN